MKIDIGTNGKILGTKRVSRNGQVSGFTEYAGQEVLVLLPGDGTPVIRRDARDVLSEVETVVQDRMRLAFAEYAQLRGRFPTPEQAARTFLERTHPRRLGGLLDKADQWIKDQVGAVEKRVQKGIERVRGGPGDGA